MKNELYHHGILGMKWGIRRYQNKDGSLTAAGRNRYGKADNKQEFDKMPDRSERDFDASIQAQKDELLKDAKEKGMFEMTFIEAIQNDYDDSNMTKEQEEKDVLARYENYLESPSTWLKVNNEYHGLSVEKAADKIYDRMMKDSGGFDKIDDPEIYELMIMEYTEDLKTAGLNPEPIIDKARKRFEPNELRHYGILGMKWGIRRYQNADGSLTAAGKKHYGEGSHVGSKQRLKRAFDAREIDDRLDSISGRRSTDKRDAKVDHLSKMREGLIKDLDEKEIRYADLYIQRQHIRREINRIQAYTTVGENALSGIAARKLARAVKSEKKYNREIYKLDREFRKNRKEAKAQAKANKS